MPSVTLYTKASASSAALQVGRNNLPTILQTPSGLAILEIQGTIHAPFPEPTTENSVHDPSTEPSAQTPIGRIDFPLYNPTSDPSDLTWMKRVHLYVGKHQRLTGEVKKLSKPLVVVGKRAGPTGRDNVEASETEDVHEELEVLGVIKHKILFGGRPEPVGD